MLGEMGAYFGQGRVIILYIWSTIKKSSPLLAKKINSPPTGTEISMEKDTGSSYGHEMMRILEIKLLLAIRRRRKLLSWKLGNLICLTQLWIARGMQMRTWFFKKVRLKTFFEEKDNHRGFQSLHLNHNISGASGEGRPSPISGVRWITSHVSKYDFIREGIIIRMMDAQISINTL